MARPINFDDLNFDDTEYIAPNFIIPTLIPMIRYDDNNQVIYDDDPPINVFQGGGSIVTNPPDVDTILGLPTNSDIVVNANGVPVVISGTKVAPLQTTTQTGTQTGTQVSTTGAPVDYAAKLQTLATEKPLLVFGAIGLGLYFLLKDKK